MVLWLGLVSWLGLWVSREKWVCQTQELGW